MIKRVIELWDLRVYFERPHACKQVSTPAAKLTGRNCLQVSMLSPPIVSGKPKEAFTTASSSMKKLVTISDLMIFEISR